MYPDKTDAQKKRFRNNYTTLMWFNRPSSIIWGKPKTKPSRKIKVRKMAGLVPAAAPEQHKPPLKPSASKSLLKKLKNRSTTAPLEVERLEDEVTEPPVVAKPLKTFVMSNDTVLLHSAPVRSTVVFSAASNIGNPQRYCITGSNNLQLWSLNTFECIQTLDLSNNTTSSINQLVLSNKQDKCLVAATEDGGLSLLSIKNNNTLHESETQFTKCHTASVTQLQFTFGNLETRKLVSSSEDWTICIWNPIAGGACLRKISSHSASITSFLLIGFQIISASADSTIKVTSVFLDQPSMNSTTGDDGAAAVEFKDHSGSVQCLLHTTGSKFISASIDKTLRLYDIRTKTLEKTYNGHTGPIYCMTKFLLGTNRVASGAADGRVLIHDIETAAVLSVLSVSNNNSAGWISRLAFHPNNYLAIVSNENIHVWKISPTKSSVVATVATSHDIIQQMTWVKDNCLLTCGLDNTVRLWALTKQ